MEQKACSRKGATGGGDADPAPADLTAVHHPWVQVRVQDVDEQVRHHDEEGREHGDPHDGLEVVAADGLDGVARDPIQVEHVSQPEHREGHPSRAKIIDDRSVTERRRMAETTPRGCP
jgi:hypothetical protein